MCGGRKKSWYIFQELHLNIQKQIVWIFFDRKRRWFEIYQKDYLMFFKPHIFFVCNRSEIPRKSSYKSHILDKSKNIELTFKNLKSTNEIFYNFGGQRYSKKPTISFVGDKAIISIENPGRDTKLFLFIDKTLALEYKVYVR